MKKNKSKKKRKKNELLVTHYSRSKRNIGALIKVLGVGGGGGNAITRMMDGDRIKGVEFISLNTDAQDLDYASAHKKLYIGRALTKGLGAGMNPEIGKQAAEENRSEIGEAIEGADIVFITAGMGGGTGTGAAPIIADIAKEKGILTIGVVTKPFTFEGSQRMHLANEGLNRLRDKVDALVVIPNDKIFNIIDKDTTVTKAFLHIDEILKNAVKVVAELINAPGIINVDFADIKAVIKDSGTTLIGIGSATGLDRGVKAVEAAINSPLLEISIEGAKGVLFSITGGRDMKMSEINDVARAVASNLDGNAKVIFGAYHDRSLKDKTLKVTVIATGFSELWGRDIKTPSLFMSVMDKDKKQESNSKFQIPNSNEEKKEVVEKEKNHSKKSAEVSDPWEIPAFLRKKKK